MRISPSWLPKFHAYNMHHICPACQRQTCHQSSSLCYKLTTSRTSSKRERILMQLLSPVIKSLPYIDISEHESEKKVRRYTRNGTTPISPSWLPKLHAYNLHHICPACQRQTCHQSSSLCRKLTTSRTSYRKERM